MPHDIHLPVPTTSSAISGFGGPDLPADAEMLHPGSDVAVIVGRFQTDRLHSGHVALLNTVFRGPYSRVVVVLGVAPMRSKSNPLDFWPRARMIQEEFPSAMIVPFQDQPTDEAWSAMLDQYVRMLVPVGKPVLFGGRDSFIGRYQGRFDTVELDGKPQGSATQERKRIAREVRPSEDFRAGLIYGVLNDYDRVTPAVDIAAIRTVMVTQKKGESWTDSPQMRQDICLIRKPGQNAWRLPGGFVDVADATLEVAAARELREETGLTLNGNLEISYVMSRRVEDWRSSPDHRITTSLFKVPVGNDKAPVAGDDAAEADFFSLEGVQQDLLGIEIYEPHRALIAAL